MSVNPITQNLHTGFVHVWLAKIPWLSITFSMTFWKIPLPKLSNCSLNVMWKQSLIQLKLNLILGLVSSFFNFGSYCLSLIESVLIFHDFPWTKPKFHDFPGLENEIIRFHDFPGFPWPVRTLSYNLCKRKLHRILVKSR